MRGEQHEATLEKLIDTHIKGERQKKELHQLLRAQGEVRATTPSKFDESVAWNNTGETAYQRAIVAGQKPYSDLDGIGKTHWRDIELPVVFGDRPRRPCLDLLGCNGRKIVLCELKYMNKSSGQSPVYALLELLVYYYQIQKNASELAERGVRHEGNARGGWNWNDCRNPEGVVLTVAANERYWDRWNNRNWDKLVREPVEIIRKQMGYLNVAFFQTASLPCAKDRVDEGERYTPEMLEPRWERVAELS